MGDILTVLYLQDSCHMEKFRQRLSPLSSDRARFKFGMSFSELIVLRDQGDVEDAVDEPNSLGESGRFKGKIFFAEKDPYII